MSVITISRGSFSRGKEVAEALASELDYECISREILVEASDRFQIPELTLGRALHDAPSLLERFNHGQEQLIGYFKSAFLTHMAKDNVVYHGLAGHFFLQNISHVLKVRIIANQDDRIREEMQREGCSQATARERISRDDEARRRWGQQLFAQDSWDSRLYDMVLSVDSLGVDDIVELLLRSVKKNQFAPTPESVAALQQRLVLAHVQALLTPMAPNARVQLEEDRRISISNLAGPLRSDLGVRRELAHTLKDLCSLEEVRFREPIRPERDHINTFFNLEL
ncbi:cytidylate kinase-like family protein [Desulfogranum mediterraneum]|uniref:cytidylate kinase-like family protein n=1 Tax=Desulfogranum mediterraneum TaxID=160661 RepID=UPI00040CDC99|nr:cytidylate kinase-like family protein [Desulfogranum mediterraneum]